EELLPTGKQFLQLVTRRPVGGQRVGVGPVLGQPLLELGNGLLPGGDLGFDLLELAGSGRLRGRGFWSGPRPRRLQGRRGGRSKLVSPADVVGPAAVMGADCPVFNREGPV